MKTVRCKIHPDQAHSILCMLEGEDKSPVSFVVAEKGVQLYHVELEAWVDGTSTAHTVKLNTNGTWEFFTEVEV